MGLLQGTNKTGVIVRTPKEPDLTELSHFFIGSIYHYDFFNFNNYQDDWEDDKYEDKFVLVEDFVNTIDELLIILNEELSEIAGLEFTLERNEI